MYFPPAPGGQRGRATTLPLKLLLLCTLFFLAACDSNATPTPIPATPTAEATKPPASAAIANASLIYVKNNSLIVLDGEDKSEKTLVDGSGGAISWFAVAPGRQRIAYVAAAVWLLDLNDPQNPRKLADLPPATPGTSQQPDLAFSPDGSRIAVANWDPTNGVSALVILDLNAGGQPQQIAAAHGVYMYDPVWSPDGRYLAYIQGEKPSGVGYDATVYGVDTIAATGVFTIAQGSSLPDGMSALPPLAPTWINSVGLSFQQWNISQGTTGTWLADVATPPITPRLLITNQLGLATWSSPTAGEPQLAYRAPGDGIYVANTEISRRIAAEPSVGSTGAFAPLWSADARYIAFTNTSNQLLIADHQTLNTVGRATGTVGLNVLRAAWNNAAGADARIAAIGGRGLEIYDAGAHLLAALDLTTAGSPQEILWRPDSTGGSGQFAVRYTSGVDNSPYDLIAYDDTNRKLELLGTWNLGDDFPLAWVGGAP